HWDSIVRESSKILGDASDKAEKQADAIGATLGKKTAVLQSTVKDAKGLVETLKEHTKEAGIDDFLKRATFISERLQSLAVDMSRLMETTISEDDWRRFNRGEKGVFVRKMLGFREKSRLQSIRQRFQENDEFREYVQRYMSEFKGFLDEARKRDKQGVLSTIFLSSDMGKLFMVLTQALGRELLSSD
ncbi:MAG: hypothetical protein HOC60_00215, partial [Rhodospirillaceae bacterium]|nr:hypothetical protein [Rhodospirillaceae bacterium]